jgi:uncharacterized LabA/DUF88 family protein
MQKTILLIDGENLRHKIEQILINHSFEKKSISLLQLDIAKLMSSVLGNSDAMKCVYYSAKLHVWPQTLKKSIELIKMQRNLKTKLEKQGFTFLSAGNVRPQVAETNTKNKTGVTFKEKGVDVKLAVDLVVISCDKTASRVILCSSDSDLQPAVKEARKRGIHVTYLGFESSPNKGLTYTTDQTILIKDTEIINAYKV